MAEAAGDEFGNILNSMLQLKPPGVSGSKIKTITELCVENVQYESLLMQRLYTHFKKAPGSHKLGVLYVVDSIVRAYIDEARRAGQETSSGGPDGTFAAGVAKITDMLSSLMNDIMQHAPDDTKEKIKKLVDIWARGSTFPSELLAAIRSKHFASPQASPNFNYPNTSTPDVAPPNQNFSIPSQAPASNTAAILAALAQMAKQTNPVQAAPPPTQNPAYAVPVSISQAPQGQLPTSSLPIQSYGTVQGANAAPQAPSLQNLFPSLLGGYNSAPQINQNGPPAAPFAGLQTGVPMDQNAMQQFQLLQLLSQNLQGPQLAQAIEQLGRGMNQNAASINQPSWPAQSLQSYASQPPPTGDNYNDDRRGPYSPGRDRFRRGRSRSRSPHGRFEDNTVRRRSPVYGEYDGGNSGRGGDRDYGKRGRGRGGNFSNDRGGRTGAGSRFGRERSASPGRPNQWGDAPTGPNHPKFIDWDDSLKPDRIKVFSRTLFVGGVSSSEADLRNTFQEYGDVQSCIVNYEKRHAFIKMKSRQGALRAKEGMEANRHNSSTLRTRWGVGFGPRDCSDYSTGISIIPIERLTDADRRWLLTADFGGTGGVPMEPGMVIEEPDIEIGQGVSSKAISRRMQTDNAGHKGPKSTAQRNDRDNFRERDRYGSSSSRRDYDNVNGGSERENGPGVAPPTPGFGLGFPAANMGMPFIFPGGQPNQH